MVVANRIARCYEDPTCLDLTWSPQDLQYTCPDDDRLRELNTKMKLKVGESAHFPTIFTIFCY